MRHSMIFGLSLLLISLLPASAAEQGEQQSGKQSKENTMTQKTATALFGNGCFWCTEAIFKRVDGVISVTSGYAGGKIANPSYKQVCEGDTGHAECLKIVFDPTKVSFERLLWVFFQTHDPTTLNRQGNDVGTQYRSVVFCQDEAQKADLKAMIEKLTKGKVFDDPIVTEIADNATFYPAEDYHQDYFQRNPLQGYCRAVVAPKVAKFEKLLAEEKKKAGK